MPERNDGANEQVILDMHLHTREYSSDSGLYVRKAVERAKLLGLSGLCVTDHDSMGLRSKAASLSQELEFPIFVGVEVLTTKGDFIVFGFDKAPRRVMEPEELMSLVAKCDGAVWAAHPYRWDGLGVGELIETLEGMTGIECFNGGAMREDNMRALRTAQRRGLARLGGSDSHRVQDIGRFATLFHGSVHDENDIIKLVHDKACEPVAWNGTQFVSAENFVSDTQY